MKLMILYLISASLAAIGSSQSLIQSSSESMPLHEYTSEDPSGLDLLIGKPSYLFDFDNCPTCGMG